MTTVIAFVHTRVVSKSFTRLGNLRDILKDFTKNFNRMCVEEMGVRKSLRKTPTS